MTTPSRPCLPCPPPGSAAALLLCDTSAAGVTTQFLRIYLQDGTVQNTTLGGTPYVPTGTVAPCTEDQTDGCDTTTPVAVAHLCLADGTPLAVVVARDCDGTVSAPGYVNLLTGAFTAGPVPAGAAPCDGLAVGPAGGSIGRIPMYDVQPDGTFVGFLRSIGADGTITDTTLDGAPFTPTGTVQLSVECETPTTPVATTGLCLADGTPIAMTVERDCDGVVTRTGWIDLTTGTWSAGAPPAGTRACGETSAFDVSGVFCDVDPVTGDVLGLVLVQVERGPDGEVTGTVLLNPSDGSTYVLQGVLSSCPAGVSQPQKDIQLLCDVAANGTATPFLRDYARDQNGAIVGHTNYTLAGAPYAPTGTVGLCQACAPDRNPVCVVPLTPMSTRVVSNPGNNTTNGVDPAWTWGLTPAGGNTVFDIAADPAWTTPLPPGGGWVGVNPNGAVDGLPCAPGVSCDYYMVTEFEIPAGAVLSQTTLRVDTLNADNYVLGYTLNGGVETPVPSAPTGFTVPPYTEPTHAITGAMAGTNRLAVRVFEDQVTPFSRAGVLLDVTLTYFVAGTPEYWTVEYGCDGSTTYIEPDGTRHVGALPENYLPCDGVCCGSTAPDGGCQAIQVCIAAPMQGQAEFITNPTNRTSGIDVDWTWGQTPGGPWFQTYDVLGDLAWTVADTAPNAANWVSPHPNSSVCTSGEPGEGPEVLANWYARAFFTLPAEADPASIRIAATVLNADNDVVEWRLNGGAWQPVGGGTHVGPPVVFGPQVVPGAQAGVNEIVVHISESTPWPACQSAAGMKLHVIATYAVPAQTMRSWTRMVCADGDVYYLDESGGRQTTLPEGFSVVPCNNGGVGAHAFEQVLCDTVGPFVRQYTQDPSGAIVETRDYDLAGNVYEPTGAVGLCP